MASRIKIYFDGGCRPNPGEMETAVVCGGRAHLRYDHGFGTAMDAEWLALIAALTLVRELGMAEFVLLGDAAAVIAQAQGRARRPFAMLPHYARYQALAGEAGRINIRYVKRAQNLAGIALARRHPR